MGVHWKGPRRGRIRKPLEPSEDSLLFELPPDSTPEPLLDSLHEPIWTKSKAKLIEWYLYHFVLITRHGVYIDAFAGPQQPEKPKMWAAKLVLESEPKLLRSFYLIETNRNKIRLLQELKDAQPPYLPRSIEVIPGDCNVEIVRLLKRGIIRQTEACFCLLDQHTFECKWETLRQLASYKTSGYKIELFYFLCNAWFDRALTGFKDKSPVREWWGREDVDQLRALSSVQRKELIVRRFKDELGYSSVKPWPIYERQDGGGIVMYYMVHATDHPEAPKLMRRAYLKAVLPTEPIEQLDFGFGLS